MAFGGGKILYVRVRQVGLTYLFCMGVKHGIVL